MTSQSGNRNFYVDGRCKYCNLVKTPQGHDPCIANLPGVVFACCGHGHTKGYLKFDDGRVIHFYPIDVDLDKAEHSVPGRVKDIPVYISTTRPRVFSFRTRKIRKKTSGYYSSKSRIPKKIK